MTAKKTDPTDTFNSVTYNTDFVDIVPKSTDPDTRVKASAATHARMAQVGSLQRTRGQRHDRAARARRALRVDAKAGLGKLRQAIPFLAVIAVGGLALVTTIPAGAVMVNSSADSSSQAGNFSAHGEEYAHPGQTIEAKGSAVTTARDGLETSYTSAGHRGTGPSYIANPNGVIQWPFAAFYGFGDMYGPRDLSDCSYCSPFEEGVDVMAPLGTPVMNTADGVVTKVHPMAEGSGYGVYIQITHNVNGIQFVSQHSHMLEGSVTLQEGQTVKRGQTVGQVGMTGSTSAPHDCFLIFVGGSTTDPIAFMDQYAS